MPRRRDWEEDSLPKFIDELQHLAGIMASWYLERQYRKAADPGFLLIGFGTAALGAYALGGCVGSFLEGAWEAYIYIQKIGEWQGGRPS